MKHLARITILASAISLIGSAALAHHSFAMFDNTVVRTMNGALYNVEWKNPHSWIWVKTLNNGKEEVWGFEGAGTGEFIRKGFSKKDFVVGEKVKVEFNPLKDGRTGGKFLRMTFPDGRVVGSLESATHRFRKEGYIK